MILTKLQEALAEVESQRVALDEMEGQLRSMIARLSGGAMVVKPTGAASLRALYEQPRERAEGRERDKLDEVADILRSEGKPLHITVIADRLSAIHGQKTERTKIEPGINRHIAKVKQPRIAKFGPSMYGLPEWKAMASPQEQLIDVA